MSKEFKLTLGLRVTADGIEVSQYYPLPPDLDIFSGAYTPIPLVPDPNTPPTANLQTLTFDVDATNVPQNEVTVGTVQYYVLTEAGTPDDDPDGFLPADKFKLKFKGNKSDRSQHKTVTVGNQSGTKYPVKVEINTQASPVGAGSVVLAIVLCVAGTGGNRKDYLAFAAIQIP